MGVVSRLPDFERINRLSGRSPGEDYYLRVSRFRRAFVRLNTSRLGGFPCIAGHVAEVQFLPPSVMANLQKNIAAKFLATLAQGKEVDSEKIEKIRKLLEDGKKPKADDFIKIFSAPTGGDVT